MSTLKIRSEGGVPNLRGHRQRRDRLPRQTPHRRAPRHAQNTEPSTTNTGQPGNCLPKAIGPMDQAHPGGNP